MAEAAILPPDVMMDADDEDAEDYRWKKDVVNSFELGSMPCSNCMKKYLGTGFLNCRHFLCSECIDQSRNANNTLNCPVSTCCFDGQNAVVEDVLAPMVQRRGGGKAMEDDLLYDPPLDDGPYKNLLWFQGMMKQKWLDYHLQTEYKRSHPMDGPHDYLKGSAAKRMVTDLVKAPAPHPDKPPAQPAGGQAPVEEDHNVEAIIETICRVIYDHDYILGFYPCHKTNKVVLDVREGHREKTEKFIREKIQVEPHMENARRFIEIATQKSSPVEIISTGDKVANDCQIPEGQHQDILRDPYGTVACLARDTNGNTYAITTKHCFGAGINQPSVIETEVMSSMERRLEIIGNRHIGHKGIIQMDDNNVIVINDVQQARIAAHTNKAVDIAAVPLLPAIVARLDQHMLHDLQPYFRSPDKHARDLLDKVVTKTGATSGHTSGVVKNTRYYEFNHGVVSGEYLVIFPNDRSAGGQFARAGDSGALAWRTNDEPIGIVAKSWENYYYQGKDTNITLAVRLDNNIDALNKVGVPVERLMTYGAPLPVDRPAYNIQFHDAVQMQQ